MIWLSRTTIWFLTSLWISSCSGGWSDSAKEDFLSGCLKNAQLQAMPNGKDYCICMQRNVEKKYPDFQDFENLPIEELQSIAKMCSDSATANNVYWSENVQETFLKGCADVAKEKGIANSDVYCACVMEGVMYYYPKAEDLALMNKDSLDKISSMCQTYYEKDTAR